MEPALIFSCNKDGVIGKNGKLLWKFVQDMNFFKATTENNIVIMGRKTYEEIGKALPNRINIVVTSKLCYEAPGCEIAHSLKDALSMCKNNDWVNTEINAETGEETKVRKDVFIIGGKRLFEEAMPIAGAIFRTMVDIPVEIDENTTVISQEFANHMRQCINFPFPEETNLLTPDDKTLYENYAQMFIR